MNILYVCGYAAEYPGNFIKSLMRLDQDIRGTGECCFIFPPEAEDKDWIKEIEQAGAHVFYNTQSILGELKLQNKICKKYSIDIIYHHFWNLEDCLANRILKARFPKVRMVIHHHNEYHISDFRINEVIKHWILDADMHIGCGEYVSEEVRKAGFQNVRWIDNCIDFDRLDCWEEFAVPDGINCLTFSSYGYDIKGIDISINAAYAAREKNIPINLLIAVSSNYEEIKRRVQSECRGNIPEWIQLLPARTDVAAYYHAVDAYLNASRSEGFCYASIEAIYCGAQVIQTRIPGNRLDVPNTFIFDVDSVEQCTDCICMLYQSTLKPDLTVKSEQKQYVLSKYGLSTWVKEEMKALNSIL